MDCDERDCLSDMSSPLSSPANSPSPPPELRPQTAYPSPPASQQPSQSGSPCPDDMESTTAASDKDGPPPAKRRRTCEPKQRTTEYLDLRDGEIRPSEQAQMDRLLHVLHKRRKIVVVAGAGISVSAGIPDFRSSTGLFTSLRAEHNIKGSGKHLFDASVYKDNSSTSSFHDMVRSMSKLTKSAKPTPFHHMLATLAQDDRLLRLYSQNVDGIDTALEPLATEVPLRRNSDGKWPKTVQLHGGLDKMVCSKCQELSDFDADLFEGPVPPTCGACVELDRVRTDVAGKRSHGIGRLRPRMVLYNEHNPDDEAIGAVTKEDLRKRPDAIIVVGTTLKVPGVRRIVREMCGVVRDRRDGVAIWINNDPEPVGKEFEDCWDIVVRGTCDEVARRAAMRCWYEADPEDITEEEWKEAQRKEVSVVINSAYKALATSTDYVKAPTSPVWDPLTPRVPSRSAVVSDSFTEEEEIVPSTPSKSSKVTASKKKASAFDALGGTKKGAAKTGAVNNKSSAKSTTATKAKPKAKTASKARTAPKKMATKPQSRLTSTLKATKGPSAAAKAKDSKPGSKTSPSKASPVKANPATYPSPNKKRKFDEAMRPVPLEDPRNNAAPPSMSLALFPGLLAGMTNNVMKVANLIN